MRACRCTRCSPCVLQFGEKNPGMTRVMVGDALVFENERLVARMNQFFDRIESHLRQSLRSAAESAGSATPTVDANARGLGADRFPGRPPAALSRAPGFRRSPTEHLDAALRLLAAWPPRSPSGSSLRSCRRSTVGGQALTLLPEKAAYLAESRTLLVADVHIGKAVSFRSLGVPVPRGTTAETLSASVGAGRRLERAGSSFSATSCTRADRSRRDDGRAARAGAPTTRRSTCCSCAATTIARAGDPPRGLGIEVVDEPLALGRLQLCHHPRPVPRRLRAWPATCIPASSWSGGRTTACACRASGSVPAVGVLPAFGAFTGMHPIEPAGVNGCSRSPTRRSPSCRSARTRSAPSDRARDGPPLNCRPACSCARNTAMALSPMRSPT